MKQTYGIRDLEQATGLARTTIHFYLRQGLLPRPQKSAASRSLYTEEHVAILRRISGLKEQCLTLADIELELRGDLDLANEATEDLAALEYRRLHDRILAVAARDFAGKGYKNTHITALVRELGITATTFYHHFSSKRRLLAECVTRLAAWSTVHTDAQRTGTEDPAERLLWTLAGHERAFELASSALAVLRLEGTEEDVDLELSMESGLASMVGHILEDLDHERERHAHASQLPGEPIALHLFGSYQPVALSRIYEDYSRRDLLEAHLWLFLAAQAARNGEVDIDARLARYQGLITRLASGSSPLPPGRVLEDP
jgi:AcrR family transcriptional regulator